jgi:hypothetical protein
MTWAGLVLLVGVARAREPGPPGRSTVPSASEAAQEQATRAEITRAVSDRSPPRGEVEATLTWLEQQPVWLSRLGAEIAPLPLSRTWTAHVALATAWIDFGIEADRLPAPGDSPSEVGALVAAEARRAARRAADEATRELGFRPPPAPRA